ncbi:PREDICTED: uncharacterized protein C9orf84 homolog [Nanorana parkeri]|uniref:uncharacterized protein C9orf84 homolog n=1 Tax=Nanorana parkeri TaxID=125878 RepID=UPI00085478AE|nr:PREDICTED: uncharacterized protein C9orf84 homolog [Nanorana parkeri]
MFPAFKFLSLDYAFENVMKQKLAISWMHIPFPNEILQEEDYFHTKVFVNDTYRRPWKRSIPTCQIQEEDLLIDMWKTYTSYTYTSFDDFLERKEEALAIVPSSNPCSQIDQEDVCSVSESGAGEASHTDECWKTLPSSDTEDNLLPEEAVFVDCLLQFRQHLPSLSTLLKRLKTIPVQDPLLEWKETLPTKELLFSRPEGGAACPEYRTLVVEVEVLVEALETNGGETVETGERPARPERDRRETIKRSDLPSHSVWPARRGFRVPIRASARREGALPFWNLLDGRWQLNLPNLPTAIPEYPESHVDIEFPLLKVSYVPAISPHHTIDQLMEKICIRPDKLVDSWTLEDNYQNEFGLTIKHDTVIEKLNSYSTTGSLALNRMESVTRITPTQLERVLEEKQACVKQRDNFQKTGTMFISQLLFSAVPPAPSQCQAYQVLQAAAVPILNKLTGLGVSACAEWNFASVSFDSTRFLLCQQEKTVTNKCKIANKSNKDMILFKNASFLHILVTLRDLILMCTLDAALEYLCNAKSMYKSVLESCLNDVWRKLRIIQYVQDKTKEANPKITALLQWMEETYAEQKLLKILILSRMHSEAIKESLNISIEKTEGLKAIALCPVSGNPFLDPKNVLDRLRKFSYIIVNNKHIGSDFPWVHFSLVIEYDCTDVWLKLCQDLNVPHVSFISQFPDPSIIGKDIIMLFKELLLHIQIPYVFLSSEGLTNNPEILHLLESRYNMTFIERECCPSLQLFGKADNCAVITVDESTVIILQSLEGLIPDKSAENLILKLVALSLQYSCCWVLLYAKEKLNSEYNLSEMTLHNVALVYAALTAYLSKSEDLQIKTFISPGIDKTGLLIRHIADHTLMLSASDPYKWLDRSWLSILLSEEENVLLSFPSINPMMAQRMLSRGSSLQWLLSATHDQLKKLFPEMPSKVLKHFNDITALHKLSTTATSQRPFNMSVPAAREHCCSPDNIQSSSLAVDKYPPDSSPDVLSGEEHGIPFSQPPQQKRRKLICERVPGRCDGQTRLKFF